MRLRVFLLIVSASLSLFTGCVKAPKNGTFGGVSTGDVIFGEYGAMTGPESSFGRGTHRGITMAVEAANTAGGINGRHIKLVTYDDEGKTDMALTAVTRLVTQDRAVLVLGEVASTRSIAAGAILQQYHVPMVSPSSTNPKVTQVGDYIFRICFIDPFQGTVMAKFSAENLKIKTAAILRDMKSDYSVGLADFFKREFEKRGGKVVADLSYAAGDIDFRSQLNAVKTKMPEALFIPGYYTEVGLIARQARELNFQGKLLGGDGWDGEALTQIGGSAVVGGYFSNHYSNDDKNPVVQNFVKKYQEKYHELPTSNGVTGYDAASVAVEAARHANPLTSEKIREALARIRDFPGVTGKISIDANRDAIKSATIVKVAGSKHYEYVTTILP